MQTSLQGWPSLRHAAFVAAAVLLSGCGTTLGPGFSGTGQGFGGFGAARQPAAEADGYTMRRLTGRPDQVGTLEPDMSVSWPKPEEDRPSVFETEDERRSRERRAQETEARPPRVGSSTESRQLPPQADQPLPGPPPRALAEPPEPVSRGAAIPGAPPGTVTTGVGPRGGTFGGPGGSGTVIRDGGTTTLMGADGTIRTVPTPR